MHQEGGRDVDVLYWLVLFIVFILFEIITLGLTTIWFASGALIALIASLLGADVIVQIIIFIVVSVLLLIFTRPYAKKFINDKTTKTNVDDLIGKTGKVTETIDNINSTGLVYINGLYWLARSANDLVIYEDEIVTIIRIEGVKLIVSNKREEDE